VQPDAHAVQDHVTVIVGELDRHAVDDALRDPVNHPKRNAYPFANTFAHGLAYQLGDADADSVCHRDPNAVAERVTVSDAVAVWKRVAVGFADSHAQSNRFSDK
jgi:hypothetical protein